MRRMELTGVAKWGKGDRKVHKKTVVGVLCRLCVYNKHGIDAASFNISVLCWASTKDWEPV